MNKDFIEFDINREGLFIRVNDQKKVCCIYLILSPSGKMYVGQTEHFVYRLYKYSKMRVYRQQKLFNSFEKYGWQQHKYFIIKECLPGDLNKLEEYYVDSLGTFNTDNGLNLRSGGNHYRLSNESIEKMRKANIGKRYSAETNYKKGAGHRGKKLSSETKEKMLAAQRNRSEDHIRNHKAAAKSGADNHMFGKKWTEEHKKAHSEKIKSNNKKKKELQLCFPSY